jgi:hypothetical protein
MEAGSMNGYISRALLACIYIFWRLPACLLTCWLTTHMHEHDGPWLAHEMNEATPVYSSSNGDKRTPQNTHACQIDRSVCEIFHGNIWTWELGVYSSAQYTSSVSSRIPCLFCRWSARLKLSAFGMHVEHLAMERDPSRWFNMAACIHSHVYRLSYIGQRTLLSCTVLLD